MNRLRTVAIVPKDTAMPWVNLDRLRTVAAVLLDADGYLLHCNELFGSIFGARGSLASANLADWLADGLTWSDAVATIHSAKATPIALSAGTDTGLCGRYTGELIESRIPGENAFFVGLFTRESGFGAAQSVLARNGRLEAVVCLTSGVAHDFNNLLTVLTGNLALAAEDVRSQPGTFAKLKSARDAASRGGQLIRQLLAFARQNELGSELIDPVEVIRTLAPLLERALGAGVELQLELDDSAGRIHASAVQFESSIVNLAVNARDALGSGGTVRISVRGKPASARPARGAIEVVVADNGSGIESGLLGDVLKPFHTTKADSGGTGLGLSMVDAFVRQHGGELTIESQVGLGTSVRMIFACAADCTEESNAATMPLLSLPSGTETVVVVARDESICGTVEQILTALGYQVITSSDMHEANRTIRTHTPDVIVADGFDIRALLNATPASTDGRNCGAVELVGAAELNDLPALRSSSESVLRVVKPFSLPDLAKAVRTVLDRR